MKKIHVCFEGIDGAGKRTQADLLAQKFGRSGINSKIYTYPDYNSDYGKMIDRYLHDHLSLTVDELFMLFLVDMVKDIDPIKEEIDSGAAVIMDRYFYSTIAYQCAGGYDYKKATAMIDLLSLNIPSIVFYLDIPPESTADRKMKQKGSVDKHEKNLKYMREVKGFYDIMYKDGYGKARWIMIDGSKPITDVHQDIVWHINEILGV